MFLTRKYVGNLSDFRVTKPERFGDPSILWIKTSLDSVYGKIQAYSMDCKFIKGDRLYIRRILIMQGLNEYWIYQIENETISYRLSRFEFENKIMHQVWY